MSDREDEVWRPYRRTVGYDSHGPLVSRPAPYCHRAVSSKGELGTANPRTEQPQRGRKPKKRQ